MSGAGIRGRSAARASCCGGRIGPVFGVRRFVLVLNVAFACPQQWRLWQAAKVELRRARAAVAAGEEAGVIYAGGRDVLSFGEGQPRRWGAPDWVLRPSLHALLAQFRDFPSIPDSSKIIPGYVEGIPGYPSTGISHQAVDFTVTCGGLPVVLGLRQGKMPVIFPVERELAIWAARPCRSPIARW